ncbi:MAG TPA: M14 family zinc carboxypeptidase, partial [Thermoleophilaceae bacterium]|nr:M14 family zinc carboxypeptidase [Thermoleophilaceae bacterium]
MKHELSAAKAKPRHCATRAYSARGVDVARYRAPMSGFVTASLAADDSSDWDLTLFDAATGRALATSAGFGSREVTQTWVASGQRLVAQGCRRKGRDRTAAVSFRFADAAPPKLSGTPQLVKVRFRDRAEFERLRATGVDVTHHVHDGVADVVVQSAAQARALRRRGFSVETEIADLEKHFARSRRADARFASITNRSALPSGRDSYRVYDDYQRELKELAEDNTDIVKPMKLPRNSFQGRELSGLEIGERVNESAEDGRPVFLLVAMHHAREWPSSESAMEFAHMLVQEYRTGNQRVSSLLDRARIVVVPLINPDGFISSRGFPADPADTTGPELNPNLDNPLGSGPEDDDPLRHCTVTGDDPCQADKYLIEGIAPPGGLFAYRRKNCNGGIPNPSVPCELQYGVDPNRNYGEKWGGPGADADRTSQGYRGTGPWSESETQAVHLYSQRRQITSMLTIHNVAALVLRPPGLHFEGKAPDEDRLKEIGDAMGDETGYESQFGFQLYDTAGTTEDWNYAAAGTYGFTIEIGPKNGEFHMPYETGVVREWTGEAAGPGKGGLREAYLIAAESAANEADHGVLEGTAPAGRTLRLKKRFYTNTSAFCDEAVEPPLYFTGGPGTLILPQQRCIGERDPIAVPDKLETTLKVPSSGQFEWHVNPSTRPFVGKDKE